MWGNGQFSVYQLLAEITSPFATILSQVWQAGIKRRFVPSLLGLSD